MNRRTASFCDNGPRIAAAFWSALLVTAVALAAGGRADAAPTSSLKPAPVVAPAAAGASSTVPLHAPSVPGPSATITAPSAGGAVAANGSHRTPSGGITLVNGTRVDMGILDDGWADISGRGFGDTPGVVSVLQPYRPATATSAGFSPAPLLVLSVMSWSDSHIRVRVAQPVPNRVKKLAVPSSGLFNPIPNLILDVAVTTPDGDVHYQASPFSVGISKPIYLNGANNPP